MLGTPVTLDLAREALADLVRSSARSLRLADIDQAVCAAFGISESDLKSTRRSRAVNQPRMLAMFLARKHTGAALADIGPGILVVGATLQLLQLKKLSVSG